MIICGIDPGTRITGYGILDIRTRPRSQLSYVSHGTIRPKGEDLPLRLKEIFLKITDVFREYRPDEVAIETTFHALNAQSALKLGQARGAIILAASLLEIPVFEYTPTEVKKATCGYGHAGKDQISAMIATILHLPKGQVASADASDALAIGLCHSSCRRLKELVQ
ncbi:MAG TPA: crossover junction endodeoxyribonuclease RuvC [Deltaproteobacteria bacterium]|jgi:crossover junction endodeoxyribonuclease RuvC|nr:crossover junction endodeoxyribonuclease RuvC [Deltaproteobacteria bacterium]HOI07707.1 crossover junction endodeoxyribonuclease RuvC [Deltaproteobacteria bacterium]